MNEQQIVNSSFTAIINAPIEKIDIPALCFSLPEKEYQGCSPAHVSVGSTTAPDGNRWKPDGAALCESLVAGII